MLNEIDRKNLNYNFNFQFNAKKNRKQINKNAPQGLSANANEALFSGAAAGDIANKEDSALNTGKTDVDRRKNSSPKNNPNHENNNKDNLNAGFFSSNKNNNNNNNDCSGNNIGNGQHSGIYSNNNIRKQSHIESALLNGSNAINNSNNKFSASETLLKRFSGNSLLNSAANGNSSLDTILSLNDSESNIINHKNNNNDNSLTLALNENSTSGYIRNSSCNAKAAKGTTYNKHNNNNININVNRNLNNQSTLNDDINNNNYFNNRMEALNGKLLCKNSSCNSYAGLNKDKHQVISLPDLDKKKSFCSNGSEAASTKAKNSLNHLELLKCLKQKELEIMKAQRNCDRKNEEKMLSKELFLFFICFLSCS